MFSALPKTNFNFSFTFISSSTITFNLDLSKILWFGKKLNLYVIFLNPLPNNRILIVTKLKAFVARMVISLLDRVENTEGKGENAGYQHFLLFLQCFPKPSS